jgi:multidrug efflux pump subunit AcrA (membrane-fusion protein)
MAASEPGSSPTEKPAAFAVRVVLVRIRFLAVPLAAFVLVASWPVLHNAWDTLTRTWRGPEAGLGSVSLDTEYFCPMCPGVLSDWPGKCPVCNMALVQRKRGAAVPLPDGVVARMQLSPYRVQLAGVRTEEVAYRPLVREVETAGTVEADDQSSRVCVRGEVFTRDLPFLTEGAAAEVACEAFPGHAPFPATVREVGPETKGGVPALYVHLDVDNAGGELRPGLFVTARVRVPVQQTAPFRALPTGTPTLRPGEPRTVYVCPDHPDQVREQPGRCPLDQKALEARPLAANQRLGWWCPMHPHVTAEAPGGECPECHGMKLVPRVVTYGPPGQVLAVPEAAVVDTGAKKVVYVERMPGMYDGVEVVVGARCGDYYPVVRGVEAGQRVVGAGAFLLDAETRLNPGVAAGYFGAARGGAPTPSPPAPSSPAPESAKVAEALGKLAPADRALALRQKVCPVTGALLGSMGPPPAVVVGGRTVFLCCKGCEAELRKDPAKYLGK